MPYPLIKFPLELAAVSPPERGLRFTRWFLGSLSPRIGYLQAAIRPAWEATFKPDSLVQLDRWYRAIAKPVTRTPEQIAAMRERLGLDKVPAVRPSDFSASLAIDIGMYFGEMLRNLDERLEWRHTEKSPVPTPLGRMLVMMGDAPPAKRCDPVGQMLIWAHRIVAGEHDCDGLPRLFEIHSRRVLQRLD